MKNKTASHQNIVLLGLNESGKTSLMHSLTNKSTTAVDRTTTHAIHNIAFEEKSGISLMDFGGQLTSEEILSSINDNRPAAIIFALDSRDETFESSLKMWDTLLCHSSQYKELPKFLAITRCDIGLGTVPEVMLNEKYHFKGIYRTSAKTGEGIQDLRSAVRNAIVTDEDIEEENEKENIAIAVKKLIDTFCELVAKNPNHLNHIEWRDLEILVAEVLDKFGFNVVLTPPAQDGGKDVIAKCIIRNEEKKYYIEIKHWKKNRAGDSFISKFVEINAYENTAGGLFLSTSGYTKSVCSRFAELTNQNIKLGDKNKIVSLCQKYVLKRDGIWYSDTPLPELLFESTLN